MRLPLRTGLDKAGRSAFDRAPIRVAPRLALQIVASALLLLGYAGAVQVARAGNDWPAIALPSSVQPFQVGEQIVVNGQTMRIRGFVSDARPQKVLEDFRKSIGQPLVENTKGNKRILGRAQDGYYLTVQIAADGLGSRGFVAVASLKDAVGQYAGGSKAGERWRNRLPAGSRLVSHMESEEMGKRSVHLVIVNPHAMDLNRESITAGLRDDGLHLEREAAADVGASKNLPPNIADGTALFFRGQNSEAMAVIGRETQGRTFIVLNVVTGAINK